MNTQKLTQKSLEAIQSANGLAIENQNQQIEQVHLLKRTSRAGGRFDSAAVREDRCICR